MAEFPSTELGIRRLVEMIDADDAAQVDAGINALAIPGISPNWHCWTAKQEAGPPEIARIRPVPTRTGLIAIGEILAFTKNTGWCLDRCLADRIWKVPAREDLIDQARFSSASPTFGIRLPVNVR